MFEDVPVYLTGALFLGLVGVAIAAILASVHTAISIHHKLKRQPPIEETLDNLATKPELRAVEARQDARIREIDARLAGRIDKLQESQDKASAELYELIRRHTANTDERFERYFSSTQKELQTLSKEVGLLRGTVSAMRKEAT